MRRQRYEVPRDRRPSLVTPRHKVMVSDLDIVVYSFGLLAALFAVASALFGVASLL